MNPTIYTVGYSGFFDPVDFEKVLKKNGVNVLIDVRSSPFSKGFEQYNRDNIESFLSNSGIYYRNYAREFGARQTDRKFYKNGRLDFDTFAASEQFREGVSKLEKALEKSFVPCLMCAEKNPTDCHRAVMVARAFHDEGINVIHLMPENETKTQEDVELELINKLDFFEQLSVDEEEVINTAYRKQNDAIGYREENL